MGLKRRDFLKLLGVTGMTLAVGENKAASSKSDNNVEFNGILYDSTKCKGCRGCEFDCADAHNLPMPPEDVPAIRKTSETSKLCNKYIRNGERESVH